MGLRLHRRLFPVKPSDAGESLGGGVAAPARRDFPQCRRCLKAARPAYYQENKPFAPKAQRQCAPPGRPPEKD